MAIEPSLQLCIELLFPGRPSELPEILCHGLYTFWEGEGENVLGDGEGLRWCKEKGSRQDDFKRWWEGKMLTGVRMRCFEDQLRNEKVWKGLRRIFGSEKDLTWESTVLANALLILHWTSTRHGFITYMLGLLTHMSLLVWGTVLADLRYAIVRNTSTLYATLNGM